MKCFINTIKNKYYWHDMTKNISKYVQTYDICQHVKSRYHKQYDEINIIFIFFIFFEIIFMNFIIKLLSSNWLNKIYDIILIIVDTLTKFSLYVLYIKNIKANDLRKLYYNYIFIIYNTFKNLILNCNIFFISHYWFIFYYYLNIKHCLLTVFHS